MPGIRLRLWIDGNDSGEDYLIGYSDANIDQARGELIKNFKKFFGRSNIFTYDVVGKDASGNYLFGFGNNKGMMLETLRIEMFKLMRTLVPINTSRYPATGGYPTITIKDHGRFIGKSITFSIH